MCVLPCKTRGLECSLFLAAGRVTVTHAINLRGFVTMHRMLECPSRSSLRASVSHDYRSPALPELAGGDIVASTAHQDGSKTILLADFSAKGERGSLLAESLAHQFRFACAVWKRPSSILAQLNRSMVETVPETEEGLFASVLVCRIVPSKSYLVYSSAGAEPPILFNTRAPYWRILTTSGLLLGVQSDTSYVDCRIPIEANDVFIAFTDGITESKRRGVQERLGRGGIVQALRSSLTLSRTPHCTDLFNRIDSLNGGLYRDDATLLVAAFDH